jgi:uncharacterized membrane protein YphA (DoxX/SURF4 family)
MKNASGFPQLFLRLALGLGFILPVLDRLGILGAPGSANAAWGDWDHFVTYTNVLLPWLGRSLANIMALLATIAEALFGICLIIGYKTRTMALGGGILTLTFAICMILASGINAPFKYPVFVFSGAGFLLSCVDSFKWSVDRSLPKVIR